MKKSHESSIHATAPGKLILSGEHAVVYGNPALVMAVNRYVTTSVTPQPGSEISFLFPEISLERRSNSAELLQLQKRIHHDYQAFLQGNVTIKDVLKEPIELIQFALGLLLEACNLQALPGMQLSIKTNLSVGCGMGSSAAVVISVLKSVAHYLQIPMSAELLFDLAHQAESMQHGKSSGLDLHSSLHGGCLHFKAGQITARTPSSLKFYTMNTGRPQTTTGECVAAAATHFKNSATSQDFADITHAMDRALQANALNDVIAAMRENHQLLTAIGVVPKRVQNLIAAIENVGGSAKISGAGAVAGDNAGLILIAISDEHALTKIAENHSLMSIECEPRGAYVHEL